MDLSKWRYIKLQLQPLLLIQIWIRVATTANLFRRHWEYSQRYTRVTEADIADPLLLIFIIIVVIVIINVIRNHEESTKTHKNFGTESLTIAPNASVSYFSVLNDLKILSTRDSLYITDRQAFILYIHLKCCYFTYWVLLHRVRQDQRNWPPDIVRDVAVVRAVFHSASLHCPSFLFFFHQSIPPPLSSSLTPSLLVIALRPHTKLKMVCLLFIRR